MRRGKRTTIWILAGVLASAGVVAAEPEHSSSDYQGIIDRNVFDLHPPPTDTDGHLTRPQAQIPKLTLNGMTTILGKKLVILTTPATKPGVPPETLMLAEGQAQDEVEVREIDENAGSVKVVNHGEEQTLDFDQNGAKPAPTANPGRPLTIPSLPPPTAIPPPAPGMNVIRPLRTLPSRAGNPFSANRNSLSAPQATQ
jgi:hypothetical protein